MTRTTLAPPPSSAAIPLRDSILGLGSLALPGLGFVVGLALVSGREGFPDLADAGTIPWELWLIGVAGIAATVAGYLDWRYHITGRRLVGARERKGELIALGFGGVPLFFLMMAASVAERPEVYLLPILATVLFTTGMICYDEFVFHRRSCTRFETALHRTLVFGNGTAWAAWMHWIFVRG
ncbi:MAG: hypothetical protein R3F20_02245 [Planctomycetota bacterium]